MFLFSFSSVTMPKQPRLLEMRVWERHGTITTGSLALTAVYTFFLKCIRPCRTFGCYKAQLILAYRQAIQRYLQVFSVKL